MKISHRTLIKLTEVVVIGLPATGRAAGNAIFTRDHTQSGAVQRHNVKDMK